MTKSKKWHRAMLAVVSTDMFSASDKLDILELLAQEKRLAEFVEKEEAKKQEEQKNG